MTEPSSLEIFLSDGESRQIVRKDKKQGLTQVKRTIQRYVNDKEKVKKQFLKKQRKYTTINNAG